MSSSKESYELFRIVKARLSQIDFQPRRMIDVHEINSAFSMKELIISSYDIDIDIDGSNRFKAEFGLYKYYSGLMQTLLFGYNRARRQIKSVESSSKDSGIVPAWILITAYYGLFFRP